MRYKLVIFDLDGTLLNTIEDLGTAVNHALSVRGLPTHSMDEYKGMVGHGIRDLVTKALPAEHREDAAQLSSCLEDFVSYYSSHIDVHTVPYPHIVDLLNMLKDAGVMMAIASNKFQEGTQKLASRYFPDIEFIKVIGNRPGLPLKPAPEVVEEILAAAGVSKEEAVMVGDSSTDLKTAQNGGIQAIAVSWGYRDMTGVQGITIAHSADELQAILVR